MREHRVCIDNVERLICERCGRKRFHRLESAPRVRLLANIDHLREAIDTPEVSGFYFAKKEANGSSPTTSEVENGFERPLSVFTNQFLHQLVKTERLTSASCPLPTL